MHDGIDTIIEVFDSMVLQNNVMASIAFRAVHTIFLYEPGQEENMAGIYAFLEKLFPEMRLESVRIPAAGAKDAIEKVFQGLQKQPHQVLVEINGGSPVITNYARENSRRMGIACVVMDARDGSIIPVEHAEGIRTSFPVPKLSFADILMLQGRTFNRNMHMLAEERYFDRIIEISEYAFSHQADFKFFYDFVHHKSNGELSEPSLKVTLTKTRDVSDRILQIFRLFEQKEFIHSFKMSDYHISFQCVEPFVKEMLAVKGSWLEMYVYILARRSGLFEEVHQSVMIGWDLERRPKFNVENEIDVVLMKKGTPIFISCKMSNPKPDALNEIYALANSFGGYGAVPALATCFDVYNRNKTLWNRAQEMGVALIEAEHLDRSGMQKFFERL